MTLTVLGLRSIVVGCSLVVIGCTPQVRSVPTSFDVQAGSAALLRGEQSIALKNGYDGPAMTVVDHVRVDLKEFTDTAIAILERHMRKNGITVDAAAPKSITLRVTDLWVRVTGFQTLSTVTLEAAMGVGTKTAHRVKNNLYGAQPALDGAVLRGVTELLHDDQFVTYVNGP